MIPMNRFPTKPTIIPAMAMPQRSLTSFVTVLRSASSITDPAPKVKCRARHRSSRSVLAERCRRQGKGSADGEDVSCELCRKLSPQALYQLPGDGEPKARGFKGQIPVHTFLLLYRGNIYQKVQIGDKKVKDKKPENLYTSIIRYKDFLYIVHDIVQAGSKNKSAGTAKEETYGV